MYKRGSMGDRRRRELVSHVGTRVPVYGMALHVITLRVYSCDSLQKGERHGLVFVTINVIVPHCLITLTC